MPTDAFADLMRSLDAPMAVVTASDGNDRGGCLVGFHCQASIHPARYAVWLSKANHTYRVAVLASHLGVHFLTDADHELARHFGGLTGDEVDKLAGCAVEEGPEGVPLLSALPHRLVLQRTALLDDDGDHVVMTGEALAAASTGPFRPLRLSDVGDVAPGHDTDERPRPPTERAERP